MAYNYVYVVSDFNGDIKCVCRTYERAFQWCKAWKKLQDKFRKPCGFKITRMEYISD